jgi:hypothetical protein
MVRASEITLYSDFPWFESKKGALVLVVLVVLLIMVKAVISTVLASSSCTAPVRLFGVLDVWP